MAWPAGPPLQLPLTFPSLFPIRKCHAAQGLWSNGLLHASWAPAWHAGTSSSCPDCLPDIWENSAQTFALLEQPPQVPMIPRALPLMSWSSSLLMHNVCRGKKWTNATLSLKRIASSNPTSKPGSFLLCTIVLTIKWICPKKPILRQNWKTKEWRSE